MLITSMKTWIAPATCSARTKTHIKHRAQIAMDDNVAVSLRVRLLIELAQHVAPNRKAVEVSGEDSGPVRLVVKWME